MAVGHRAAAGWLPCLRFGPDRWWLPLSHGASELLAQVILSSAPPAVVVSGAEPVIDSGLRQRLIARLGTDPPLLIYAALASSTERGKPEEAASLAQLADWLIANATERFRRGESSLGAPRATAEHERRWRQLDDHFRTQPLRTWLSEAVWWLEVAGPPVPADWRESWPTLAGGDESVEPGPAVFPSPMLAQLARHVQSAQACQRSFDARLRQEKLEAIRQLAYGLSHEINNPLANISTRAQQLQRKESDPDRAAVLQRIVDQVYRAHAMIADLMFFANPPATKLETVELRSLVEQAAGAFQEEAQRRSIRLVIEAGRPEIEAGEGPLEVTADRHMIIESINVLLHNALEAVGSSGTVIVRVQGHDGTPCIEVADSGPGLSEEAQRHAFDLYYSGREAGRGLGLGLCRAYRIAHLHGAELALRSGPAGCVATLTFASGRDTACSGRDTACGE